MTVSRVSIALTVVRLFGASLRFKVALYAYTAFMFVVSVVTASLFGVVCGAGNEGWELDGPGRCWPTERVAAVSYLNGGLFFSSSLSFFGFGMCRALVGCMCARRPDT